MAPTASLKSFMSGLIDYAGVYPPASLSVAEAMENYRRYLAGDAGWMLGRFVLPVERLSEVTEVQLKGESLMNFVAVGRGGWGGEQWMETLQEDIESMELFSDRHANAFVDVLEVALPLEILQEGNAEELKLLLDQAYDLLDQTPYYEVPFVEGWEEMVKTAVKAIRTHYGVAGFKLRCGGAEAHQVPSSEQLAYAIKLCIDNGISLKCVSGLYRPVYQLDPVKNFNTHGFLNVFGAGYWLNMKTFCVVNSWRPCLKNSHRLLSLMSWDFTGRTIKCQLRRSNRSVRIR